MRAARVVSNALIFFSAQALAAPTARIVSLTPALAEMAYEILPSERDCEVVGVSERTRVPAPCSPKVIASSNTLNREGVMALKPDLVLVDAGSRAQFNQSWTASTRSLSEISEAYRSLGVRLGEKRRGEEIANRMESDLRSLRNAVVKEGRSPRVLFQVDSNPLIVLGGGSDFLVELMSVLGFSNVFGSTPQAYPRVSRESAMALKPDWVIVLGLSEERSKFRQMAAQWPNQQVLVFDSDQLTLPSRAVVEGAKKLAAEFKARLH